MGNCQTKSAAAVADRQQGPSAPCRSDSYDSSDASSVDDARLMVSKASDEELDGVQEEEEEWAAAIMANLRPLDAVQVVESITANEFEASATNGIEVGLRMVSDARTDDAKDESKPTVEAAKLTVVTAADPSAVESTKPPKSTSRTSRSTRSTRTSSSRHRHQSKRRGSRRAASPGLPKASTSSVADRSHLLDELDGLVASFSMSMAGTSNEEEGDSDSGDEVAGLAESVVIGVVPLPGEEPTAKAVPVPETNTNVTANAIGAIVPFDTD